MIAWRILWVKIQLIDSQTKDLDEYSTRGFDIIARVFGLPRHKEAIIDPDSSLSYY